MATFSGTAQYEIKFNRPTKHKGPWLLKLGDVRESAKVWLNDQYLGILWSNPYQLTVDNLKNCDIFINCKHDGFNQVNLLYEAAKLNIKIINI